MKRYLAILLSLSFLFGCKKAAQDLPTLTRSGRNVIAIKVNGNVYTTSGTMVGSRPANKGVYFVLHSDSTMIIGAANGSPIWDFSMTFAYSKKLTSFQLGAAPFSVSWYSGELKDYSIVSDSSHNGIVNIVYYDGKILSRTFEYDGLISDGSGVTHVEGNFDIGQ